ncbi:MAG: C40 family peptidase [Ancrocorticia sp.]|uniref:C40 family peptidase n=1 Tax=Ancrocorticia sp. TaxID=2593684 RepID=UPI003F9082D4
MKVTSKRIMVPSVSGLVVGAMLGGVVPAAHADTANAAESTAAFTAAATLPEATSTQAVTAPEKVEAAEGPTFKSAKISVAIAEPVEEEVQPAETGQDTQDQTGAGDSQGTAEEAAPAPAPSTTGGVVGIARQYTGSAYVYGGTTPAGFDCSGFTSYVYAQMGVTLPRSSGAQGAMGTKVPASQAQPGDLVWWPGHVGIYTGNGNHIAARNPSTGVQEGPVYGSPTYIRVG